MWTTAVIYRHVSKSTALANEVIIQYTVYLGYSRAAIDNSLTPSTANKHSIKCEIPCSYHQRMTYIDAT